MPKINWKTVLTASAFILFTLPFVSVFAPSGVTPADQTRLDTIIAKVDRLERACTEPKLKGALRHTVLRYDKLGAIGVRIQPLYYVDGMNIPWCPGLILDKEAWDRYPDDTILVLLVHEAHHDFYPWLGHYQFWGTIPCVCYRQDTTLERLMRRTR